jgi:hypothetical protein
MSVMSLSRMISSSYSYNPFYSNLTCCDSALEGELVTGYSPAGDSRSPGSSKCNSSRSLAIFSF